MSEGKKASVLTVGQMISTAFGSLETNTINFKLIQAVLMILARHLRLYNRRIILDSDSPESVSATKLKVSEVKLKEHRRSKTDHELKLKEPKKSKSEDIHGGPSRTRDISEMDRVGSSKGRSIGELDKTRRIVNKEEYMARSKVSSEHKSSEETMAGSARRIKSETTVRQQKYYNILERLEEQRERVLRVIHQRKNSYEEGVTPASPLASLTSEEIQLERLFLVENISDDFDDDYRKPFNLVTQEQYKDLLLKLEMLEQRMGQSDFKKPELPENRKLIKEIRSGASLCDAMAALQISARVDATEKALKTLTGLLDEMRTGVPTKSEATSIKTSDEVSTKSYIYVTKEDFMNTLEDTKNDIMGKVNSVMARSTRAIEASNNQARKLEVKLAESEKLQEKVAFLDETIQEYAHQLHLLDNGMSSQVTNVQEQLNQVQIDLEVGLQNMSETLANKGVDTEMITELQYNFDHLQYDIEKAGLIQKESNDFQKQLSLFIERLKCDTELLRDTKCDREEFLDALRDKAGISELNGMVTMEQHHAAFTSLMRQIEDAFETFRKQEMAWQKMIDDINIRLDAQVKKVHMEGLREDIQCHLNALKREISDLRRRLGEPLAASVTRKIYRDTKCVSCSNPANITPVEVGSSMLPPLKSSNEKRRPKGEGDAPQCVPGFPSFKVIYAKPKRNELCTRYCGGSHTRHRAIPERKMENLYLEGEHLMKTQIVETVGDDKKIYKVQEEVVMRPCNPCNVNIARRMTETTFNETLEGAIITPMKTDTVMIKHTEDGRCLCSDGNTDGVDHLSTTMPYANESLTLSF